MKKRVKIPMYNPSMLLELAEKIREKHVADGEASPLKVLNWEVVGAEIERALTSQQTALRLKREKLSAYQQRAHKMESVLRIVRRSRDILTGVHAEEMKALGAWGFDVLDTRENIPAGEDETKAEQR